MVKNLIASPCFCQLFRKEPPKLFHFSRKVLPFFHGKQPAFLVLTTTGGPIGGARPAAGDGAAEALRRGQGGAERSRARDGWTVFVMASLTGGWDEIKWLVTIKTNGDVTSKTLGVKQGSDIECSGRSLD